MITTQDVRRFQDTVAALPRPVLSLYLDVNPASAEANPRAAVVRTRETLRELDVPDAVQRQVMTYLDGRTEPARTVALFATATERHVLALQMALPVCDPLTGHMDARWGEPYLLPLDLALDEFPRYGVVYCDAEHWRFFDACLGEFEEVLDAFRAIGAEVSRRYAEAGQRYPAHAASRADAAKDNLHRSVDEWTHRFHRDAARLLQAQVEERNIERLVLFGPNNCTRDFANALPRTLRDRVVATLPSLTSPAASPGEVRKRFEEVAESIEREQEAQLLARIREEGLTGTARCLEALQENRLYVLAVPWALDTTVYRDAATGYAAATPTAVHRRSTDGAPDVREVPLHDLLPELAAAYGARLELMRGDNQRRLKDELGGMGGLTRW